MHKQGELMFDRGVSSGHSYATLANSPWFVYDGFPGGGHGFVAPGGGGRL